MATQGGHAGASAPQTSSLKAAFLFSATRVSLEQSSQQLAPARSTHSTLSLQATNSVSRMSTTAHWPLAHVATKYWLARWLGSPSWHAPPATRSPPCTLAYTADSA